jgi:hypothetical protein
VPDVPEMLELRFVPEGASFDLERGASVFKRDDQAAVGEELRQEFETVLVDCSPIYGGVFGDTTANEFIPFFIPFLLLF